MHTHRRATAGFTLIEMMVVIIIMALLLAWALPAYKNVVTQYRMTGELSQIQADVELARSAAIRSGGDVTMCPSTAPSASAPACSGGNEWNTGWIIFTDANNDQTFAAGTDTVLRANAGWTGTDTLQSLVSNNATAYNTITFNRMGGTASFGVGNPADPNKGAIELNNASNDAGMRRCVTITEAGMMTVTSPQTESLTPPPPTCP